MACKCTTRSAPIQKIHVVYDLFSSFDYQSAKPYMALVHHAGYKILLPFTALAANPDISSNGRFDKFASWHCKFHINFLAH